MFRMFLSYLDPSTFIVLEGDRGVTQAVLQQKWDKLICSMGAYVSESGIENELQDVGKNSMELMKPVILKI